MAENSEVDLQPDVNAALVLNAVVHDLVKLEGTAFEIAAAKVELEAGAQRRARGNRSEVELCRVDAQCRRNFVAAGFA